MDVIEIINDCVDGWRAAIRGMRNPMNSWDKSDSAFGEHGFKLGEADIDLMRRLAHAGADHGKFARFITVTCDIYAPLYWWKQFDQYRIGVVTDSCSTMHKIHSRQFTLNDFSHEHMSKESLNHLKDTINLINHYRKQYNETHDKSDWWQMIQLLPSSYNQLRTVQMNYQNVHAMVEARKTHKLDEWHGFCDWAHRLPHFDYIYGGSDDSKD